MGQRSARSGSAGVLVLVTAGALAMTACSSTSGSAEAVSASTSVVASAGTGGSADMVALCAQMVDGAMTVEDATALAKDHGYVARVGTIDGTPQALTMDFREDRFTFDVVDGAVVACTYG